MIISPSASSMPGMVALNRYLERTQFPWTRHGRIGLRGECAHWAQVDHIALQLRYHRLLEVGRNLHVFAAADGTQLRHARDLGGEADAARTLDAAVHRGLDQRP